ncbi:ADP-ribosylation factor-like protein 2-binding protein isoform X3 [Meriones unguiculatus]|uniref:ADP-ribosylation factor-like protein 2-binding protein isoform X3 n=1 Tax=Meriones unguiculatus TaxID=10047 RepID=UPI00293E2C47|nr:ADP-ribosylation factor-like protein 2-binding protein isoform X3 [Meriones unguiculatus]
MTSSSYCRETSWTSTTRSLKTQKRINSPIPPFLMNIGSNTIFWPLHSLPCVQAHKHTQISLVEKYIEEQLLERIPGFNMAAFTTTLQHHKDEVAGDIFDMLLTFTDFLAFKEMFLDYRAEKEGRGLDLSSGLVVTSLCKSSTPASQNSLRH